MYLKNPKMSSRRGDLLANSEIATTGKNQERLFRNARGVHSYDNYSKI